MRGYSLVIVGLVIVSFLIPSLPAHAEEALHIPTEAGPVSVTMALQADTFFGFNPQVFGTYALTDHLAFAFNAVYWTDIQGMGVHDSNPWLNLMLA